MSATGTDHEGLYREKKERFDHAIHHPVPEMLKHTTSPLSAALFLFGVGTVAKSPSIRCWWNARRTLGIWNTVGWRRSSSHLLGDAQQATPSPTVHHPHPHPHPQVRSSPSAATFEGVSSSSSSSSVGSVSGGVLSFKRRYSTGLIAKKILAASAKRPKTTESFPRGDISSQKDGLMITLIFDPPVIRRRIGSGPSTIAVRGCASLLPPFRSKGVSVRTLSTASPVIAASTVTTTVSASADGTILPLSSNASSLPIAAASSSPSPDVIQSTALFDNLSQLYTPDVANHIADHLITWPSVEVMTALLDGLQSSTGLPWWAAIMTMTFALRATVLPLNVSFMRHQLRVKILQPTLAAIDEKMRNESVDKKEKEELAKEALQLLRERNARPLVQWWIPFVFPPYFLSWFATVYNASLSRPDLLTGGIGWFTDLTATDPTFLLPVMASLTWLGIVEMNASAHYLTSPRLKMWTRFTALALVPVLSTLPAAVFCFWIPSNLWEILRISIFNQDPVRKALGIPLRGELPPVKPATW